MAHDGWELVEYERIPGQRHIAMAVYERETPLGELETRTEKIVFIRPKVRTLAEHRADVAKVLRLTWEDARFRDAAA